MYFPCPRPNALGGKRGLSNRLENIDWDFSGYSSASAFSAVHWHPCRFVSQIPASVIGLLSEYGDIVLDPFCGSGTTLIEAHRLGRVPIGSDLNPVSTLISSSKLIRDDATEIRLGLTRFKKRIISRHSSTLGSNREFLKLVPPMVQAEKWYHIETVLELAFIWSQICNSRARYSTILRSAFSSILLKACNETRHWGYVCDNTRPKGSRIIDVMALYTEAVNRYIKAYAERDKFLGEGVHMPLSEPTVVCSTAVEFMKEIPDQSVDLIVTSPPYMGVCDYIKAQRLSMEWFGYEIERFRKEEIGARSKRHRKASYDEYIDEMYLSIKHMSRVIKRYKYLTLVMGESKVRKSIFPRVLEILRDVGFHIEMNQKRAVSIQRRQNPSILQENVIVAKKR